MAGTNKWVETDAGRLVKNFLLRAKLTVATKATGSTATAAVDDFYDFPCMNRGMPNLADNPVWSVLTDDPNDLCGRKYVGKSEGYDIIELQAPAILAIKQEFELHRMSGDVFSLEYTYDDPLETKIHKLAITKIQIVGVSLSGGEVNAASTMTIKLQPRGGDAASMATLTSTARVAG